MNNPFKQRLYRPFKHRFSDLEVTYLSDQFIPFEEFSQFVVDEDEYLCGLPDDIHALVPSMPIVVKAGIPDQKILDNYAKMGRKD